MTGQGDHLGKKKGDGHGETGDPGYWVFTGRVTNVEQKRDMGRVFSPPTKEEAPLEPALVVSGPPRLIVDVISDDGSHLLDITLRYPGKNERFPEEGDRVMARYKEDEGVFAWAPAKDPVSREDLP